MYWARTGGQHTCQQYRHTATHALLPAHTPRLPQYGGDSGGCETRSWRQCGARTASVPYPPPRAPQQWMRVRGHMVGGGVSERLMYSAQRDGAVTPTTGGTHEEATVSSTCPVTNGEGRQLRRGQRWCGAHSHGSRGTCAEPRRGGGGTCQGRRAAGLGGGEKEAHCPAVCEPHRPCDS